MTPSLCLPRLRPSPLTIENEQGAGSGLTALVGQQAQHHRLALLDAQQLHGALQAGQPPAVGRLAPPAGVDAASVDVLGKHGKLSLRRPGAAEVVPCRSR